MEDDELFWRYYWLSGILLVAVLFFQSVWLVTSQTHSQPEKEPVPKTKNIDRDR